MALGCGPGYPRPNGMVGLPRKYRYVVPSHGRHCYSTLALTAIPYM
jgi:hypothetical protein